ncbi:hypothetical protein Aspvir_002297 [Aspergillus viridinutans]|uniref:Uncharacterized protein n=1 Tax=Aspergillus viridinutans TaxID=75553 RepID=A0A9P3C633_ASPVI|nr:uncharacterized protein Aspvir_002297 [Aspergillus viridinutans]GIK06647.1 hypothetical protein Aspvir_002297 [Aspergillus viridinutans]
MAYGAGLVAYIANSPEDVADCRKAFNIVTLAVIINTFRNTVGGSFAMLEWYIVFSLVVIIPSVVALAVVTKGWTEDKIGFGLFLLWYAIYLGCQPWLAFGTLHQGSRASCDPKAAFGNLYMWPTLVKPFSIVTCCAGFCFLILALRLVVSGFTKGLNPPKKHDNTKDDPDTANGWTDTIDRGTETATFEGKKWLTFRIVTGLAGVFGLVCVQRTLRRNKIEMDASLADTSQLVPFLIGLFTLLSSIWSVIKRRRSRKKEVWDGCPEAWELESQLGQIESEEEQRHTHVLQLNAQEQQLQNLLLRLGTDQEELQDDLVQLEREEQEFKARLEQITADEQDLQDRVQQSQERVERLTADEQDLQERVEQSRERLEQLQNEELNCKVRLEQLERAEKQCRAKLDISTTVQGDFEARMEQIRSEEQVHERRLEELKTEKQECKAQLVQSNTEELSSNH